MKLGAVLLARLPAAGAAALAAPKKVLRCAFRVVETGFDPAQVNDPYSRTVAPHGVEGLMAAHMPYKTLVHRVATDLAQPQRVGDRRPLPWQNGWPRVGIAP
ncbi:MAG: hypothetical protein Fur0014_01090 [Rubrivivax sp.]